MLDFKIEPPRSSDSWAKSTLTFPLETNKRNLYGQFQGKLGLGFGNQNLLAEAQFQSETCHIARTNH